MFVLAALSRVLCALTLILVMGLVTGCPDPPMGPDLVQCQCRCVTTVEGGTSFEAFPIGRVCIDSSNPGEVIDGCDFQCEEKEDFCVAVNAGGPTGCGIEVACNFENFTIGTPRLNACPEGVSEAAGGDPGKSGATAVSPSIAVFSGDDFDTFSVVPSATVTTTQLGSKLGFADFVATLPNGEYSGTDIVDGHIFLQQPFIVDIDENGDYSAPASSTSFYITAILDGDRFAFTSTNITPIAGTYDEANGVFTMSGAVRDPDGIITGDVSLTFLFENRPPVADAGLDQVVECSSSMLTGEALLSGAGSFDPDGEADLESFSWGIDEGTVDAQSAIGENVTVVLGLGVHDVVLTVADMSGSFGQDEAVVLVEDTTPPVITITVPQGIEYVHSDAFHLLYEVTDVCTGVGDVIALLDGNTTLSGHGLASGQLIDLLTELTLGDHTFRIEADDTEDNASAAEVTFSIIVTTESIKQDVVIFTERGDIRETGLPTALLAKLEEAGNRHDAGDCMTAQNIYEAFIQQLEAQSGKGVNAEAAAIMIGDAQYLIDNCP
jgi:hypothetical protein